jgi:CelD/BcsL family acetyltransferase involved in cellulose biosynthesis
MMHELEPSDPRWREFVAGHPVATAFHHPEWVKLVADCYGFRAFAAAIEDSSGDIRSGLPVVEVRHHVGRAKWVSLPFTDYCPPLVSSPQDEQVLSVALRDARVAAGVRTMEVRAPMAGTVQTGPVALRHVLELDADPAVVYERFHPSQVRRNIKRAQREGVSVRQGDRPEDLLEVFYGLHLATRRRQGVPIQPRRFFRLLWERTVEPGLASVLIAEAEGRPVAAAVFLSWNGTLIYKFGASDEGAWSLRPNHLLFWQAIQDACAQGCRWMDFGRTDAGQEGLAAFKRSWGAREEPLAYGAIGSGDHAVTPGGTMDRALGAVIRHGPPLVCRVTGELLYRYSA